MVTKEYEIIDSVETLEKAIKRVRKAQEVFATFTQEQVDKIFLAAASAANKARIPLAKMAVEETGMGIVEDKVIKNNYASEYIYNAYKETKTLDNRINLPEIENNCKAYWENSDVYRYDNTRPREETFIVDTPPPTASGSLQRE